MPRRIYEIQCVYVPFIGIFHLYGVAFNGYATLAFQIHVVEDLCFSHIYRFCELQQAVCQCGFPVIDEGNYAEISNMLHVFS